MGLRRLINVRTKNILSGVGIFAGLPAQGNGDLIVVGRIHHDLLHGRIGSGQARRDIVQGTVGHCMDPIGDHRIALCGTRKAAIRSSRHLM